MPRRESLRRNNSPIVVFDGTEVFRQVGVNCRAVQVLFLRLSEHFHRDINTIDITVRTVQRLGHEAGPASNIGNRCILIRGLVSIGRSNGLGIVIP